MSAQDIANLLTLARAGATVWLGWETRRMAKATAESLQLQSRPYLAVVSFNRTLVSTIDSKTGQAQLSVRLELVVFNAGQVLIEYRVERISVTFKGQTFQNPVYVTRGGPIQPKMDATFFCPLIPIA